MSEDLKVLCKHYQNRSQQYTAEKNTFLRCEDLGVSWDLKVITDIDFSRTLGPECILVVALKNWEPENPCIFADLFSRCLNESCIPECSKGSPIFPVFQNTGERSVAKNYHSVSLLPVLSKISVTLFVTLRNDAFFLISNMVPSLLVRLVDRLKVVADRIAEAFNTPYTTPIVSLDITTILIGFGMLIFFTSLTLMNFPISFSALVLHFSLIYSTVWMWMGIHLKNGRLVAMFFKALCLVLLLSCYTLMIFLMMLYVILLSLLMILLSNVYVIRLMRII